MNTRKFVQYNFGVAGQFFGKSRRELPAREPEDTTYERFQLFVYPPGRGRHQ